MYDGKQPKKVHIIDDDNAVRRSLDYLLRGAGYHTKLWSSGAEFLSGAKRNEPACVILDIQMPKLNGLEVRQAMAKEGFDQPVIIMTGHGDVELAVKAMKAGVIDFIEKPFDRDNLLGSITCAFDLIAVREVQRGRVACSENQLKNLTAREREVLDGLACGYPNKTIAFDLGISSRTVEVYRSNVMAKLKVTNFADALRIAFDAGLGLESVWLQNHRPNSKSCV